MADPLPRPKAIVIEERADVGKLALRGNPRDKDFLAVAGRALGMLLPTEANRAAARNGTAALCLGPDEWLIVCPPRAVRTLASALRGGFAGQHAAVVDVSDARVVLSLAGTRARDVLAKGCAVDLHHRVFAPGDIAQAPLGKIDVILHQRSAEPAYDIHVARSVADHLRRWLAAAATEFAPDRPEERGDVALGTKRSAAE